MVLHACDVFLNEDRLVRYGYDLESGENDKMYPQNDNAKTKMNQTMSYTGKVDSSWYENCHKKVFCHILHAYGWVKLEGIAKTARNNT